MSTVIREMISRDIAGEVYSYLDWTDLITLLSTTRQGFLSNTSYNTRLHTLGYPSIPMPLGFLCLVDTKKDLRRVLVDIINTGIPWYYTVFTRHHPTLLQELLNGPPMEDNDIYRLTPQIAADIAALYSNNPCLSQGIAETYLGHSKKAWKAVLNAWTTNFISQHSPTTDSHVAQILIMLLDTRYFAYFNLDDNNYSIFYRGVLMAIEKYDCVVLPRTYAEKMMNPLWFDRVVSDVPLLALVNYRQYGPMDNPPPARMCDLQKFSSALIKKAKKVPENRYFFPLTLLNPRWLQENGIVVDEVATILGIMSDELRNSISTATAGSYSVEDVGVNYVNTVLHLAEDHTHAVLHAIQLIISRMMNR